MPTADLHRIGRYVNLTLLGQGGMGAVYRGRDPELERPVAVKVMLDSTPDFVARFRREAQSIARLTHPNIVQVYDFGVDGEGNPYFVMELIDGTPLDKVIRDRGRLQPADAVALARQAAEGLAAAHRAGIVHRDVKPSNLIVDGRGGVKLVDFGIARVREGGAQLTNAAALMGTPGYMAPEQAAGGKPVDHRADIYALGLTLYEMLAGHPPFQADDPISLVVKNMQEPLPDLRMSTDGIPEELVRLVEQMGMKSPDERLQSCEAVIAALDGIALELGPRTAHDLARADTDRIPPTNVHAKRDQVAAAAAQPSSVGGGARKRSPATLGAAAGAALVAIGLAVFFVTHQGTQTPTAVIAPPPPNGPRTDNARRPGDVSANVNANANDNANVKPNPNAVLARPGNDPGTGPLRISILPFKNSSKDPALVAFEEGIAETAVNTFYETYKKGNVKIFERTQEDKAIGEIDLAGNFHFDADTVAKLGKLKGAQVIVVGGVQLADKKVRITGRFVRVEDGQVLDVFTVTSKSNHGFRAQDEVAAGLAAKLEALAGNWRQQ